MYRKEVVCVCASAGLGRSRGERFNKLTKAEASIHRAIYEKTKKKML